MSARAATTNSPMRTAELVVPLPRWSARKRRIRVFMRSHPSQRRSRGTVGWDHAAKRRLVGHPARQQPDRVAPAPVAMPDVDVAALLAQVCAWLISGWMTLT